MQTFEIKGNKNIHNTGSINGNCIIDSTIINFDIVVQNKLTEAITMFAEAILIRAKAEENNSLANLNYSKIMLEDREVIKVMLEKLK